METKVKIQHHVDEYNKRYNTSFTKLTERYSLFPQKGEYGYKDTWPSNGKPGVYFVLNKNEDLLYIGQSNSIGRRLNEHFPNRDDKCTIAEPDKEKLKGAYYIYTTSCSENNGWERLSLEEYLIQYLNPPQNSK